MNAGVAKIFLQTLFILVMDCVLGPIGLILSMLIVFLPIVIRGDK